MLSANLGSGRAAFLLLEDADNLLLTKSLLHSRISF
jgi:hypothetical protein